MNSNEKTFEPVIGKVYRHNRLFNYVVSPLSIENGNVKCHVGRNAYREISLDYFKRDWHIDENISYTDMIEKITKYPDQTPFTMIYDEYYEFDDGKSHTYIHFNDDMSEKMIRFPKWVLTSCTKSERSKLINPYTLIMPVIDGMIEQIQQELDIINELRVENEFINIDDFKGFEFGLIKLLEKKYLRLI